MKKISKKHFFSKKDSKWPVHGHQHLPDRTNPLRHRQNPQGAPGSCLGGRAGHLRPPGTFVDLRGVEAKCFKNKGNDLRGPSWSSGFNPVWSFGSLPNHPHASPEAEVNANEPRGQPGLNLFPKKQNFDFGGAFGQNLEKNNPNLTK